MGKPTASDKNIMLIGFMGSGKSTVCACLEEKYGFTAVETDALIAGREGMSINEIFAERGEEYFRDLESGLIEELSEKSGLAVSCGGGAALREKNVANMKKNGRVVWLTASPGTIYGRVKDSNERPLLNGNMNVEYIAALLAARRPFYEKAADLIVKTDGRDACDICGEILRRL